MWFGLRRLMCSNPPAGQLDSCRRTVRTMPDKPSYLGLINAVSLGETAAHEYLEEWIKVTPNDDVRCVLQTVSARRASTARRSPSASTSRLHVAPQGRPRPGQAHGHRGPSKKRTDLEKMERFGLGRLDTGDEPDIFDGFFSDHSIDIRTGELLGRYIAEEREQRPPAPVLLRTAQGRSRRLEVDASEDRLAELERKVDQLLAAMAPRSANTAKSSSKNGRRTTSKT